MVENEANPTNEEAKKKKKKLFIVLGSILGIGAIVGASVGIYFAVKPNNNQVDVVFEKEVIGVTLETSRATIGKDYDTKILVDTSKTSGKVLKDTLDEVKSDNEILTKDNSYTYGIDNTKTIGTLHIPAEYVKGKIVIKVTLASKTATLTIRDDGSQQYGKLSHGVQIDYTIDISDCIGKDNFTINFVPEGAYENADFQIVSSNSVFTPTYNTNKAIKFVGTSELKDGDDLVITLNDKWYEDQTYINNLNDADVLEEHPDGSIGEVKALIVNGLRHKVRLIGVDKDCTDVAKPEDTKIHTTWEFVNLISDSNGYSLAAQWNDTNNIGTVNHEYTESTIHYALNGENVNNVLWAQKEATTWSSDYKCSVLDMLNEGNPGFVDVIKAP
ncbi:MAG: hypothetical protein MJ208_02615, partial [Bacilli bacterium]|nr:hypothetical protein [Bacilli bacterium]